jgi:hypothetical protein
VCLPTIINRKTIIIINRKTIKAIQKQFAPVEYKALGPSEASRGAAQSSCVASCFAWFRIWLFLMATWKPSSIP